MRAPTTALLQVQTAATPNASRGASARDTYPLLSSFSSQPLHYSRRNARSGRPPAGRFLTPPHPPSPYRKSQHKNDTCNRASLKRNTLPESCFLTRGRLVRPPARGLGRAFLSITLILRPNFGGGIYGAPASNTDVQPRLEAAAPAHLWLSESVGRK
ncbi:hypothetical protein LX36DRAFT_151646 [Colletotrichum falcatum]|nr:hypothetical protein LX36DRAFT_151646 [Colletotrichum falcatum]